MAKVEVFSFQFFDGEAGERMQSDYLITQDRFNEGILQHAWRRDGAISVHVDQSLLVDGMIHRRNVPT